MEDWRVSLLQVSFRDRATMTAAFAATETFPFPDTLEIARWVGKGDRAARLTGLTA